jgi:hypothetical protein
MVKYYKLNSKYIIDFSSKLTQGFFLVKPEKIPGKG